MTIRALVSTVIKVERLNQQSRLPFREMIIISLSSGPVGTCFVPLSQSGTIDVFFQAISNPNQSNPTDTTTSTTTSHQIYLQQVEWSVADTRVTNAIVVPELESDTQNNNPTKFYRISFSLLLEGPNPLLVPEAYNTNQINLKFIPTYQSYNSPPSPTPPFQSNPNHLPSPLSTPTPTSPLGTDAGTYSLLEFMPIDRWFRDSARSLGPTSPNTPNFNNGTSLLDLAYNNQPIWDMIAESTTKPSFRIFWDQNDPINEKSTYPNQIITQIDINLVGLYKFDWEQEDLNRGSVGITVQCGFGKGKKVKCQAVGVKISPTTISFRLETIPATLPPEQRPTTILVSVEDRGVGYGVIDYREWGRDEVKIAPTSSETNPSLEPHLATDNEVQKVQKTTQPSPLLNIVTTITAINPTTNQTFGIDMGLSFQYGAEQVNANISSFGRTIVPATNHKSFAWYWWVLIAILITALLPLGYFAYRIIKSINKAKLEENESLLLEEFEAKERERAEEIRRKERKLKEKITTMNKQVQSSIIDGSFVEDLPEEELPQYDHQLDGDGSRGLGTSDIDPWAGGNNGFGVGPGLGYSHASHHSFLPPQPQFNNQSQPDADHVQLPLYDDLDHQI